MEKFFANMFSKPFDLKSNVIYHFLFDHLEQQLQRPFVVPKLQNNPHLESQYRLLPDTVLDLISFEKIRKKLKISFQKNLRKTKDFFLFVLTNIKLC